MTASLLCSSCIRKLLIGLLSNFELDMELTIQLTKYIEVYIVYSIVNGCNKVVNKNEFHFRFISRLAPYMMATVGTCPIEGGQLGRGSPRAGMGWSRLEMTVLSHYFASRMAVSVVMLLI